MKNLQERICTSSAVAAVGLIIIGGIGLQRTFSSYGIVDVVLFGMYLAAALMFVFLGILLGIQAIKMIRILNVVSDFEKQYMSDINTLKERQEARRSAPPSKQHYDLEWRVKAKPSATSVLVETGKSAYRKEADILKEKDDEKQD